MSVQIYRARRASILGGAAVLALLGAGSAARGQDQPAQQQPSQNQPGQTPSAPAAPAPAAAPQN
ncbi:MAG: hypothetical protein WBE14_08075, partial [Xanthobacteraceae bacterium]